MRLRLPIMGHGFGPGGRLYFRRRRRRLRRRRIVKVASHTAAVLESQPGVDVVNSSAIFVGVCDGSLYGDWGVI